jgi:predicted O-methyltransferase YrrM
MISVLKLILKVGLNLPLHFLRRYKAKSALIRLASHENQKLKVIGVAIQESLAHNLSLQEQKAISLIEKRRSSLLKSDKEIVVVDYGAGTPNSNRTKEEMQKGVQSKKLVSKITTASKPKFWATMLFKIIRKLEPLSCVELGSCVGISASYQALALKINGKGAIVTLEGSDEISNLAKETFADLGIQNASVVTGPFHKTLSGVFETSKPIDFFFNDGHHDHDAVIQYFNQAVPYLSDAAVIIFDDISWSQGMRKAWTEIENDERISASIDLHTIGIAIIDEAMNTKERFKIPL